LVNYIQTNYHSPRMILVAAGGINHEEMVALSEKYFSGLPSRENHSDRPKAKYTGSQLLVRDDTMEEAHVALAVEGVGWSHPDYFTFMVFQTIVGSWDRTIGGGKNLSSKLCETIATEKLAHSMTTFNTCYSDTGLFGAYIVTEPDKLDDVIFETVHEWGRIAKAVTNSEVEQAKTKLKASLLMQLDGTTPTAEDIGRQLLTNGRRMSPAEIFLRIDAVTQKDVMRIVQQHCEDVEPVVAGIGPLETIPDYNHIRRWTYWNRM